MSRLVALLTDYGYIDTYVAQVKAVLLRLCPTCEILDLTHGIAPQNIRSGAYQLATATPYLPDGAIVIAVVDPGVGTARRAIAVQGVRHTYLAPDNGLLSLALRDDPPQHAVVLDNPRYHLPEMSDTFHGRDLFAPCAAHLANGVPLSALGTAIDPASLVTLPDIEPEFAGNIIRCKPLHIDHFGNVVFNLRRTDIPVRAEPTPRGTGVPARAETLPRGTGVPARAETLPSGTGVPARAETPPRGTGVPARAETLPSGTDIPVRAKLTLLLHTNEVLLGQECPSDALGTDGNVRATFELPLVRTFGEVAWGEPLAYWGSNGYLEVAINGGSAAEWLEISHDTILEVQIAR